MKLKIATILSTLSFSAGVLATHTANSLYPWLPVGAAGAGIALLWGILSIQTQRDGYTIAILALLLAVSYRLYSFAFPASMIGFDPDAHAVRSQVIIQNGGTEQLTGLFYSKAYLFHILGAETALITGLPIDTAFGIFPLIIGCGLVLFAATLAHQLQRSWGVGEAVSGRIVAVAALVAAVGGSTIRYSIAPIPTTLSAVLLAAFVCTYIVYRETGFDTRSFLILALLTTSFLYLHKVSVLIVFGILLFLALLSGIDRRLAPQRPGPYVSGTVLGLLGVVISVQWLFVTEYINPYTGIVAIVAALANPDLILAAQPPEYAAATQYTVPLWRAFLNSSYILAMLGMGGVSWLILFAGQRGNVPTRAVLAASGMTVGFALPGLVIGAAPGFRRQFAMASVFVAVLIGGVYGRTVSRHSNDHNTHNREKRAAIVSALSVFFVAILILTQFSSPLAAPDHPDMHRQYLTEGETDAKHFSSQYVEDLVRAEMYYGDEAVDFPRAARGGAVHQQTVPNPQWRPGLLNIELLNATLVEQEYEYVAVRPRIEIYRFTDGRYLLEWEPQSELENSYHRVYANGEVDVYRHADD
ncbi:hypothetical protein [Halegenticoccus tardaugens]|uniref:hypothetical protein n=1 Tax=Halegenticoccus tardaugens TaxID=2071624 RepID=UPI00100B32E9|nr:hypothetical protein [Halegenticoccus tardaugens]